MHVVYSNNTTQEICTWISIYTVRDVVKVSAIMYISYISVSV